MGRKKVVLLADIAFIAGAILQAISHSVWAMVAGRSIVGLAVGAGSFVAPLYIAELSPAPFRGRLITMVILFITLGQVVAYIMGWAFVEYGGGNGWRWLVGLGAVPAALQALLMMLMPETPRWLVMVDRKDEARRVLNKVFGAGVDVQRMVDVVLKGVEDEVQEEHEAKRGRMRDNRQKDESWMTGVRDTWDELFRVPGNRRALTIACLLQGLQQLCGFVCPFPRHLFSRTLTNNNNNRTHSCTSPPQSSPSSASLLPPSLLSLSQPPTFFSPALRSYSSTVSAVVASSFTLSHSWLSVSCSAHSVSTSSPSPPLSHLPPPPRPLLHQNNPTSPPAPLPSSF